MHLFIKKGKPPDVAYLFCVQNPQKIQHLTLGQRETRSKQWEAYMCAMIFCISVQKARQG